MSARGEAAAELLAGHDLRDARHHHAGDRHHDRQRGAALHAGHLSATLDQANWVLTSYIVAAAIMTPPTGWLAGRFGRKRLFLVQVAGFTLASVLCGAGPDR